MSRNSAYDLGKKGSADISFIAEYADGLDERRRPLP